VSIAYFMACPGTTDVGNAIVTERGHMTRSQPELRVPAESGRLMAAADHVPII
jgi:hypothetical protein